MVLYEHLPVYKASYDLTLQLFHVIKRFPKEFKYTIGEQMKKESLSLISSMYKANISLDKNTIIAETRTYLEGLKVLVRLSKDLHILSLEKFLALSQSLESINKQLVAREKYSK